MNSTTANVSPLWAVTCLFNPLRSRRRAGNFRTFRAHLGVPLIAVELSFDGRFELREGEAEVLVQLTGGDVMWQKERLLNVGLRHLPPACEQVALIDCDVLFEDDDWAAAAADVLTRHPVAQLFSSVQYLPRDWTPGTGAAPVDLMRHRGVASSIIVDGLTADACLGRNRMESGVRSLPDLRGPAAGSCLIATCCSTATSLAAAIRRWRAPRGVSSRRWNDGMR
ncbi:MAG: hypothetical protein IPG64_17900 [Haliea sp.]|nr:hypothetical protein [Haliea sp.]